MGDEWLARATGYRADKSCGPQCVLLLPSVVESLTASTGGITPGEQGIKAYSFPLQNHSIHHEVNSDSYRKRMIQSEGLKNASV